MGQAVLYVFIPTPDITLSELVASLELLLFGVSGMITGRTKKMCDAIYGAMDEATRRHWAVHEQPKIAVAKKPSGLQLPPGAKG